MTTTNGETRHVPAGGPATINGVLYQMLWSLMRTSRARFVKEPVVQGAQIQEVTIVLEPVGGGGDLVVQVGRRRAVEQLKARSDGGTWSLREVIESVIPDLYLAFDGDSTETDYRFVTEGRIGGWNEAYRFFRSLRNRSCPKDDPLSDLDNAAQIEFSTKKKQSTQKTSEPPFWDRDEYSERTLFEKVVSQVRNRSAVRDNEDETTTQRKLRAVLGHFEFVGGQNMEVVQREIDSHLIAIVDRNDDVPRIRDSLAMELARQATAGSAEVHSDEFFREQGLNAIPLTEWGALRSASHRLCESTLQVLGYDRALDVRLDTAKQTLTDWPATAPALAITGESGSGKSWRAYAICTLGQSLEPLSVLVNAGPTVDATLERASAEIWQQIAGHDERISLSQIGQRVRQVLGNAISPWLTLVIDGVVDAEQAIELIRQKWEEWGARVVFTVDRRAASTLERRSQERCKVVPVEDFTNGELHAYLESFLGDNWPAMPEFVRNPLRKPLMANIYRQIVEAKPDAKWSPQSEYELFAKFWARVQQQQPLDGLFLIQLAARYLEDASYPWSDWHLAEVGANNELISRLERIGWLRITHSTTGISFELTHARLLNWTCAHAMLTRLKRGDSGVNAICTELQAFLDGSSIRHGHRLGFVPMDLLWLMCQDTQVGALVPEVIAGMEGHYQRNEVLYAELVPTLGADVVDALVVRLRETIHDAHLSQLISRAIGKVGGEKSIKAGLLLLDDNNPLLQRAALPIFVTCPHAGALDKLWRLHNACELTPQDYCREHERAYARQLYTETFASLRECCRAAPDWLANAIFHGDPQRVAVSDLAYLLANIGGEEGKRLWQTNKAILFQKVPVQKRRCLATCIDCFADRDEIPWLIACVGETQDLLGCKAFSVLARLAPNEAIQQLDRLPRRELVLVRDWFADYLFAVAPDAMREQLRQMMTDEAGMWSIAEVYAKRLHNMDRQTLDMLLDNLQRRLSELLSEPDWPLEAQLFMSLQLLAKINTKDLVDHLGRHRGSDLEACLCQLIFRIGPREGLATDSLIRDELIELLFRINGDGFATAVNSLLRAPTRYCRLVGLEVACRNPNPETLQVLTGITETDETWDGGYFEQCRAAEILAEHGVWVPVINLVRRVGMPVARNINLPRLGRRPTPDLLDQVAESVSHNLERVSAGDVLVLGFGNQRCADIVRSVSDMCDPNGDVAYACAVALEMLHDENEGTVPFLRKQLKVENHRFSATNALIVNGSQQALEALADHAGDEISGAVAVNLVTRLSDPSTAIQLTRETIVRSISTRGSWGLANEIHRILERIDDERVISQILSDHSIVEFLRAESFATEGGSWHTGSKACAIRCLARIDPPAAFVAAKTAIFDTKAHDRDYYPPILAELDAAAATRVLLDVLEFEESESVKKSIGRTLASLDVEDSVVTGLASADAHVRRVACFAAGWAKDRKDIRTRLTECVTTSEDSVARAAAAALEQLSVRSEAQLLGRAIMEVTDEKQRWLYLECFVSLSDSGDEHRPWPIHGPRIGEVLTPFQSNYAMNCLMERRKNENK